MFLKKSLVVSSVFTLLILSSCSTDEALTTPDSSTPSVSEGEPEADNVIAEEPQPALTASVKGKKVNIDQYVNLQVENTDAAIKKVSVSGKRVGERGQSENEKVSLSGKIKNNTWTADSYLEPSTNYTAVVKLEGEKSLKHVFSTQKLSLSQQTYATVYPNGNSNVGVAQPVIIRFDLPVENKAKVVDLFKVKTSSKQKGAWRWYSDTEVRYRPKTYWKPGTKINVEAPLNSIPVGNGIFGQFDVSSAFTISKTKRVVKVNMDTYMLSVYENGKQIRSFPISTGKESNPEWTTRTGTKVVMSKARKYTMNSGSIGIDPNAPDGYNLTVDYAMRLTNTGEFIHAAPWNAAYFGNSNQSHGCTGGSLADIGWLYDYLQVGDPVEYVGTDRHMTADNGWGDWNVAWKEYKQT